MFWAAEAGIGVVLGAVDEVFMPPLCFGPLDELGFPLGIFFEFYPVNHVQCG